MTTKWKQIMIRWNNMAAKTGLSVVVSFNTERQKKWNARQKEFDGVVDDWFEVVLEACENLDDFNLGVDPKSNWHGVDMDYALSPNGAVKLMEGRCARREGEGGGPGEELDPSLKI